MYNNCFFPYPPLLSWSLFSSSFPAKGKRLEISDARNVPFWHYVKKKKWLQFRYDLNNYARMHTLIMKIHNNHLLFRTSKVQIKINQSEMTTKHHIFKLIVQGPWLKGLWHQYRFENKVWVLGPLCDHLIGRNSISKSAASKSYKRL